jgi:hypothetical protein
MLAKLMESNAASVAGSNWQKKLSDRQLQPVQWSQISMPYRARGLVTMRSL